MPFFGDVLVPWRVILIILRWWTSDFFGGGRPGCSHITFFFGVIRSHPPLWQVTCRQEGVNEAQQLRPQMGGFCCTKMCTLPTFNMEPGNQPLEKDDSYWKPSFWGSMWNFGGVRDVCFFVGFHFVHQLCFSMAHLKDMTRSKAALAVQSIPAYVAWGKQLRSWNLEANNFWVVLWNMSYFHPYLGKIPIFD